MNCQDDLTSLDLTLSAPSESLSTSSTGSTISLYPFILQSRCHALNISLPDSLPRVLRPLDTKDVVLSNDEVEELDQERGGTEGGVWRGGAIDSQEGDDEVLVHIQFSELVRIKSILIGTGGGRSSTAPRLAKCWVNRVDGIDFSQTEDVKAEQEWELLESEGGQKGAVEYPVRMAKFGNVSEVDLFFANTRSQSHSRIYYIGFMGETRQLKKEPGDRLTVGAETGVDKMVEGAREEKPNGFASVR
ncbi:PITH domain-domain-containing protein [Leucosporidium creatinivorum]|uniref:PITH domain-domain-containing protein n=1 Tax=Leucosporidium creatinivorum TaxID=106004 RepID=A0A1Y2FVH9_9BASI|nr:PITH domain-domain-containing protein [Leucosporidium creatinivorum]